MYDFSIKRRWKLLLIAILLLGGTLRLLNIAKESIWLDEGYAIRMSRQPVVKIIQEGQINDKSPPLYYIILHYWQKIFGTSEFFARLPSAIFGTLSIFMLFLLMRALFDESTGLIAAFLLAISEYFVRYSQEARMYSLFTLTAITSYYFLFRLIKEKMHFAKYAVATSAMLYTHVFSFFFVFTHHMYFLSAKALKKDTISVKEWVVTNAGIGIAYLPWLFILIKQFKSLQANFWIQKPTLKTILEAVISYSGSEPLLIAFAICSLAGIAIMIKEKKLHEMTLLCSWLIIPMLISFSVTAFIAIGLMLPL